jgi:ABC-type Fe3+ transport system permease subunit
MTKKARWSILSACLAIPLVAPTLTFAQGCALCYTQAAGSGSRMIAALRSGILILAIPPMLICMGITWMAYKKRNQFNDYGDPQPPEGNEP